MFTLPNARPLKDEERQLIEWLLHHGEPEATGWRRCRAGDRDRLSQPSPNPLMQRTLSAVHVGCWKTRRPTGSRHSPLRVSLIGNR
jgi:hypothetical protein